MGTGYVRNDTSNNIADGNIINAADLDGEFDAIESAMGTSGHTHDGTSAEGGPVTVLGPVQDFVASATEIKPKTTNTLDIGTSGLLFKDMFLDGVATMGSIKIDNAGTIGTTTTGDAITISSSGIVTFKDDIIVKDGGTIGVTSAVDAMTVSSAGIVTFKDDIIIKDGGTIGSASDADAIAISSGGVVTFSQAVSNLGNVTGKTSSGFVLALQTSDISIEATNVLGKIEFSAPNEDSGTDAILVGASIEALAEDTFSSSVNSTALVFKTNTTGAATERMRLTSAGDLHFLDNRKAIFGGVTSELQIYSDGSHSYVSDQGTGNLRILAENFQVRNPANNEAMIIAIPDSGVTLYHDNSPTLATTSTGVDITGTLTSDGLTVDNAGTIQLTKNTTAAGDSLGIIEFHDEDGSATADAGKFQLQAFRGGDKDAPDFKLIGSDSTGVLRDRILVEDNGDISFFEDTGTTPKFFWSAANERLGIGVTDPDAGIEVQKSSTGINSVHFANTSSTGYGAKFVGGGNTSTQYIADFRDYSGASKVKIDGSGNVGIGTDSPTRALHVNSGASNEVARFESTDTEALIELVDTTGSAQIRSRNDLRFYTNGGSTRAMDITSSGNVGIGTTSPSNLLHVEGAFSTTTQGVVANFDSGNDGINSGPIVKWSNDFVEAAVTMSNTASGASALTFETMSSSSLSEAMRIDSSGNVGIGTISPSSQDTSANNFVIHDTTGNGGLTIVNPTDAIGGIHFSDGTSGADRYRGIISYSHIENSLRFHTDTARAMRIDSSGNVGIGTSSPSQKLDISAGYLNFSNGYGIRWGGNTTEAIYGNNTGNLIGFQTNGSEAMLIDSSGNVGIGTDSPVSYQTGPVLNIGDTSDSYTQLNFTTATNGIQYIGFGDATTGAGRYQGLIQFNHANNSMGFGTNASTTSALLIDSSGNVLVGKTSADNGSTVGHEFNSNDTAYHTRSGGAGVVVNRTTSDGNIALFQKDGSTVGSIGTPAGSDIMIGSGDTGFRFVDAVDAISPCSTGGIQQDNLTDLGRSAFRFDDIYATNGTIQTSDRNEKQDIAELTDAEQRVAVAAKGLMRKFRWRDAVEAKGDEARTHFGIIAQDLQAAFAAEGLDAGDYAMFISSTWTDEETGEERTRMGVRYSELLAFIIAAI